MAGKRVEPQDIINRARALIGTRFRLHGRDPATGLDCVGLVACAYALTDELPTGYPMRGGAVDDYLRMINQFASRSAGAPVPADTLLIAPGPQQFHVGIWTGASLIHAHAGLRKVVETPGPIGDPIIATWHSSKDIT